MNKIYIAYGSNMNKEQIGSVIINWTKKIRTC